MAFPLGTHYYQIPGPQSEATFGAIMEMLLKTRLKLRLETNRSLYDEDVNAYLAGLLVSYIDPNYLKAVSEVLSPYDIDVFQAATSAEDRVHAYWIYKVNADDLLVSLGVFHRLWQEERGEMTRMSRYYVAASGYQRRIYGKTTAVGEIQMKLADGSERYLKILAGARTDYLNFIEHIRSQGLRVFHEELQNFEKELPLKKAQDELLDAYSAWLNSRQDLKLRQRLHEVIERLKALDPQFKPDPILSQLA